MTGLLVSVRNAREAQLALDGGADLIDLKEPFRGALGAADPAVWAEVLSTVAGRVPTSVALGELSQDGSSQGELRQGGLRQDGLRQDGLGPSLDCVRGFQFAKLGLSACRSWADWPQRWAQRLRCLPTQVTPVAVVYADWSAADSPQPEAVLDRAAELRCGVVLFDTCFKSQGDLLAHLTLPELARLAGLARQRKLRLVFGGGLVPATIHKVLTLDPDYIAVRGSVCRGGRTGALQTGLVRNLGELVRGHA